MVARIDLKNCPLTEESAIRGAKKKKGVKDTVCVTSVTDTDMTTMIDYNKLHMYGFQ